MRGASAIVFAILMIGTPAFADDTTPDTTPPPAAVASDDAGFDTQFQCPETITDRDAQIDEILGYQTWVRDHHPDWSFRKRLDVRYGLLRRHACAVTLANLAASARPAFAR
jgi:hypothetical protein